LEFVVVVLCCMCEPWRESGKLEVRVKVLDRKSTKNFDNELSHPTCRKNFDNGTLTINFDFRFTLRQPECATRQTNRKSKFIVKVHSEVVYAKYGGVLRRRGSVWRRIIPGTDFIMEAVFFLTGAGFFRSRSKTCHFGSSFFNKGMEVYCTYIRKSLYIRGLAFFVPRLSTIPTEYLNSNAISNCFKFTYDST
jgi:hypothetical protein